MFPMGSYTNGTFQSLSLVLTLFFVMIQHSNLSADTVYDCTAKENRDIPTTVEIMLSQKWKGQVEEIKRSFVSETETIKVRVKFFPFLQPPANIGIGKCIT